MSGLTDEEAATLAAAKATVKSAQSVVDRLEKKIFDAQFEALCAQKRARGAVPNAALLKKLARRQDFPKPASKMKAPPPSLIEFFFPPPPPPREAIIGTFKLVKSFAGVATTHSLGHAQTMRALRDAGINIYEDIARDWDRGVSIQELRRRHGIGRDTLARWIRKTGRIVNPRNGNRRYDEALMLETFRVTGSVNRAAKAAGVAWATASAALLRHESEKKKKRRKSASIFGSGAETAGESLPNC